MPGADSNPVGTLQEHAQSKGGTFPQYQLVEAVGESHCPHFTMEVRFEELRAEGAGTNKKLAKQEAARAMLALVRGGNNAEEGLQSEGEESIDNAVKVVDKASTGRDEMDLNLNKKVYSGNKIGELQEYCMERGLGMPAYTDGETTGPSHKRHFSIMCKVGMAKRFGEGGTKKEAKRQAAGAVLEEITNPAQKIKETNEQSLEEANTTNHENDDHESMEKEELTNQDSDDSLKTEVDDDAGVDRLDVEMLSQKLQEINTDILEDHTHENTPEDADE